MQYISGKKNYQTLAFLFKRGISISTLDDLIKYAPAACGVGHVSQTIHSVVFHQAMSGTSGVMNLSFWPVRFTYTPNAMNLVTRTTGHTLFLSGADAMMEVMDVNTQMLAPWRWVDYAGISNPLITIAVPATAAASGSGSTSRVDMNMVIQQLRDKPPYGAQDIGSFSGGYTNIGYDSTVTRTVVQSMANFDREYPHMIGYIRANVKAALPSQNIRPYTEEERKDPNWFAPLCAMKITHANRTNLTEKPDEKGTEVVYQWTGNSVREVPSFEYDYKTSMFGSGSYKGLKMIPQPEYNIQLEI